MWLFIHLQYLIGFKQRVTTLLHWAISFVGRGRAERVTDQQSWPGGPSTYCLRRSPVTRSTPPAR